MSKRKINDDNYSILNDINERFIWDEFKPLTKEDGFHRKKQLVLKYANKFPVNLKHMISNIRHLSGRDFEIAMIDGVRTLFMGRMYCQKSKQFSEKWFGIDDRVDTIESVHLVLLAYEEADAFKRIRCGVE